MTVIPFPTRAASPVASPRLATPPKTAQRALHALLDPSRGPKEHERFELPPLSELLHALIELAEGSRQKALVPVVGMPIELALVRRGASALVSVYHTEASPSALSIDRRVPLRALLDAAAAALREERHDVAAIDPDADRAELRLLSRAEHTSIVEVSDDGQVARKVRGGSIEDPGQERPLAFGFEASIFPGQHNGATVCHADVHAMLFSGQLWAWVRGRRIPLYRGPILLAAQRMVAAAGGFVEVWREGRAGNVRLRTGGFTVALRGDRSEQPGERASRLSLTLGSDEEGVVTIPQLEIPAATRAILRLCSELLRALCAADRSQTKNLRVRTLRGEVRRISRSVREVSRQGSFTSGDPDRLRLRSRTAAGDVSAPELDAPSASPTTPRLGWTSRWTASLPSLDAEHTHLIGAVLITHTEQGLVAIDRDSGDALWQAEGRVSLVLVSPQGVLSMGETGALILREASTGDVLFETRLSKRASGSPSGLCVSGPSIPPTAILSEGRDAISAIDLRTGELRWRLPSAGSQRLERAGRVLIVVGNDGALTAVDVVTGQLAWRFADDVHVALPPAVCGEVVTVVSGEPGRGAHELLGLDLFSGRLLYRVELTSPVEVAPIAAHDRLLVAQKSGRNVLLAAHDARTGRECWSRNDPGVGSGAGVLLMDGKAFVNAPNGRLTAVDLSTGSTRWQRVLSAAESDDVPRQLTPVLCGGALFVPSGTIHVLHPDDGASLGGRTQGGLPSDLLPDLLRIDERGWMYVGEESGHLVALAPAARLSLVPGPRLSLIRT